MRAFWVAVCLTFPLTVQASVESAETVQLHFKSDEPVIQQSQRTMQVVQRTGGKETRATAYQEINAKLSLKSQKPQDYAVNIELKRVQLGLERDGNKVNFDSEHPNASSFFKEFAAIIRTPLQVAVGKDLQVNGDSEGFHRLAKDLKLLNGFSLNSLLSEMLQPLFALAGEDLEVGGTYTRQLRLGANPTVPITLTYKIVGITHTEVRATVTGEISEADVQLPNGLLADSKAPPASLKVSGKIDGKAVWSRQNALVYKTKIDSTYKGIAESDGQEFPFELRLTHSDSSRRQ